MSHKNIHQLVPCSLALLVTAFAVPACDDAESGRDVQAADDDSTATAVKDGGDWRAALARVRATDPTLYDAITALEPRPTRAGFLRITSRSIHDPRVAPILLERIVDGNERADVRVALIEALPRTKGAYAQPLVERLGEESDADVRRMIVTVMRRAESTHALQGVRKGLRDPDASVRAEAARVAGMRADGDVLSDELVVRLEDGSSEVRAAAAQALGLLRSAGREPLLERLQDDSADVRLQALRALDRIEGGVVPKEQLKVLLQDPDARVSRLARHIADG